MAKVKTPNNPLGLLVQKKLGRPDSNRTLGNGYGRSLYGDLEYGDDVGFVPGIYQRRKCSDGVRTIRMKFYSPYNPQTEAQQANRQKFSSAVSAWKLLTDEEKKEYNELAKGKNMSGYNFFIRQYMLSD